MAWVRGHEMIIMHDTGLREIHVDGRLLLLTEEEYRNALHRGTSVTRNRQAAAAKKQEEDANA